jgi:nitroimidazol reductase NimA-like FMN-containing flavoprotein (pyridoxamine 5'-phosphate oxidase superfamily)
MRKKEREIRDNREIELIIDRCDVCRVAFANDNIPYLVTMNFGFRSGVKPELFFHCATEGRKLDMIRKNDNVCFEMDTDHQINKSDEACDFGMRYSSVVGFGKIYIITDEAVKKEGLNVIMKHYSGRDDFEFRDSSLNRTTILRLEILEMTGKKA